MQPGNFLDAWLRLSSNHVDFMLQSWIIIFFCYYLHSWFYLLADWNWYGFRWFQKYSIRSKNHSSTPDFSLQYNAIKEGTIDTFLLKPLLLYFLYPYLESFIIINQPIPSFYRCLLDYILMNFIFSTSLYFLHRLLHHPSLYKYYHKKHHTFKATIGFASLYAHPVESLISSFHFIIAIILIRPHYYMYLLFLFSVTVEFVDSHCGYYVPWSFLYPWSDIYPWGAGVRIHDYHHSHNIGCYGGGVFGLWDRLLGTDKEFQLFEQKRLGKIA